MDLLQTVNIISTLASLSCILVLFGKWVLQPQWRSTITYIGLCQLAIGNIVVIADPGNMLRIRDLFGIGIFNIGRYLNSDGLLYFFCWSYCYPLAVHEELTQTEKPMKHKKIVATALSFAIFGSMEVFFDVHGYYDIYQPILLMFGSILLHLVVILKLSRNTELMKRDQDDAMRVVKCSLVMIVLMMIRALMTYVLNEYRYNFYMQFPVIFCVCSMPLTAVLFFNKPAHTKLNFCLPVTLKDSANAKTDEVEKSKASEDKN